MALHLAAAALLAHGVTAQGSCGAVGTPCDTTSHFCTSSSYCQMSSTTNGLCASSPSFSSVYNTSCDTSNPYACQSVLPWNTGVWPRPRNTILCSFTPSDDADVSAPVASGSCSLPYSQLPGDPCAFDWECTFYGCNKTVGTCPAAAVGTICSPGVSNNCGPAQYCHPVARTCTPRVLPGGACPYSLNTGVIADACVSGNVCYAPPSAGGNGMCIRANSLLNGALVPVTISTSGSAAASVLLGAMFCASGLMAPVVTTPLVATVGVCVASLDWSLLGQACTGCSDANAVLGPNGTALICAWQESQNACEYQPMTTADPNAVAAAYPALASCATTSSVVSPTGGACDASDIPSYLVTGVVQPYSCLYYSCFNAFAAFAAAVLTPNSYAVNHAPDVLGIPSCAAAAQVSQLSAAGSSCELPTVWAQLGWSCTAGGPGGGGAVNSGPSAGVIVGSLFAVIIVLGATTAAFVWRAPLVAWVASMTAPAHPHVDSGEAYTHLEAFDAPHGAYAASNIVRTEEGGFSRL